MKMSQFKQETLKIVVAQICQTIGFEGIFSTPLEVLVDLLNRYLLEMAQLSHRYSEHFGRTEPNLDDLGLAFQEIGVTVPDLEEYLNNVDFPTFPYSIPQVPIPRRSYLNFLKPGSRETLSRPVSVHEHLPPMYPEKEEEEIDLKIGESVYNPSIGSSLTHDEMILDHSNDNCVATESATIPTDTQSAIDAINGVNTCLSNDDNLVHAALLSINTTTTTTTDVMPSLSPGGGSLKRTNQNLDISPNKRSRICVDDGEPVREIDSVMMTTSGFISSAREGKMPEGKMPNIPLIIPRSSSPTNGPSTTIKKKLTIEKIIRQKNGQMLGGSKVRLKDKLKPKIPGAPPGTNSMKMSKSGGTSKSGSNSGKLGPLGSFKVKPPKSSSGSKVGHGISGGTKVGHSGYKVPKLGGPGTPKPGIQCESPKSVEHKSSDAKFTNGSPTKSHSESPTKVNSAGKSGGNKQTASTPKLKIPTPKIKMPKNMKGSDGTIPINPGADLTIAPVTPTRVNTPIKAKGSPMKNIGAPAKKKSKKDKVKDKDSSSSSSSTKKVKEPKKDKPVKEKKEREPKKEKTVKKEGRKENKPKKDKEKKERKKKGENSKDKKKEREEKDNTKQKEREKELIAALAASSAVTVVPIPAPVIRGNVTACSSGQDDGVDVVSGNDGRSKLSIFKKLKNKCDVKDDRHNKDVDNIRSTANLDHHMKDLDLRVPATGDRRSRDSSPDLMIDDQLGRDIVKDNTVMATTTGQVLRRSPIRDTNVVTSEGNFLPKSPMRDDTMMTTGQMLPRSPIREFSHYTDDLSSPGTPNTPRTPELPPHIAALAQTPEKRKGKEKGREKRPRKERKSPKGRGSFISPSRSAVDNSSVPEIDTPDRPKTPEVVINPNDMDGVSHTPFNLPQVFQSNPSFIPPFSRFPFTAAYTSPRMPHRPISELNLPLHNFYPHPPLGKGIPSCSDMDITETLDRPLTPRHDRKSVSPIPPPINQTSPIHRSPSPSPPRPMASPPHISSSPSPPRPRTPLNTSSADQTPSTPSSSTTIEHSDKLDKSDKSEKEKKKEHKKEKKEKEKEKEKSKKKKDKKDREKEKADKKKEKEKIKHEKKERKRAAKTKKGNINTIEDVPRLTVKFAASMTNESIDCPVGTSSSSSSQLPVTPKLVIKPIVKHDEDIQPQSIGSRGRGARKGSTRVSSHSTTDGGDNHIDSFKQSTNNLEPGDDDEPGSPEIAKFSALITRPPRHTPEKVQSPTDANTPCTTKTEQTVSVSPIKSKDVNISIVGPKNKDTKEVSTFVPVPSLPTVQPTATPAKPKESTSDVLGVPSIKIKNPPIPTMKIATPKPTPEDKKVAGSKKTGNERKERRKKVQPGVDSSVSTPEVTSFAAALGTAPVSTVETPSRTSKRNNIQTQPLPHPVVPGTAAATLPEPPATGLMSETVGPIGHFVDDQGNEVWICPTCGKQDDGSPMIGCDTCDDWYHWVCVGIQVPPSEDENWYCPRCLSQHKQRGAAAAAAAAAARGTEKKKRGRKRK